MLVGHVFDFALILRSRRRELRLRQEDLASHAGVSRGFICDLEHGKPTVELGKVLQVMDAMNVPLSVGWNEAPPDWTKPIIKRVLARERGWAELRPRSWRQKLRPPPAPPQDWFDRGDAREAAARAGQAAAPRDPRARPAAADDLALYGSDEDILAQIRANREANRQAGVPEHLPAHLRETDGTM